MSDIIRIYFWGDQRQGNNQIKVGKKKDMEMFSDYVEQVLKNIDRRVFDSTKEPERRYYVEDAHIKYMRDDSRIDLKRGYVWKENGR